MKDNREKANRFMEENSSTKPLAMDKIKQQNDADANKISKFSMKEKLLS
jgi:hypothetical protein